jgi:hypothetical protein
MSGFLDRCKGISILLVCVMLLQAAPLSAMSGDEDQPKVENVRIQTTGPMIYIYYDLVGPPQQVYEVTVTLRSRADSTFKYTPLNISGDIGTNVFTGVDWRAAWNFAKEFPEGLKEDYYFVISAKTYADQVVPSGIKTEYLIAGGAAVVGGVLAIILLKKKSTPDNTDTGFPQPPARP